MIFRRIIWCCGFFFKMLRVVFQTTYGVWKVSRLPKPLISIFGGAQLKKNDRYWRMAHELAAKLTAVDISVLTGGGPGVMEAVNCGAVPQGEGKGVSMGIGVKDLGEGTNPCVQEYHELDYFFARKWLLTRYSSGFVVFPGGFGTLDELTEVLTLIQTKKIPRVPIILIGVEYWDDFMAWVKKEALDHGLIDKKDLQLFTLTDDIEQAFCLVRDACKIESKNKDKSEAQ